MHTIYKLIIDETHDFHKVVSKEDGLKFTYTALRLSPLLTTISNV
jgi:hypothetical protein